MRRCARDECEHSCNRSYSCGATWPPPKDLKSTEKITARRSAEIHEREGKMYAQAEKYAEALAAYQRAQKRYPDEAGRLNYNLAQIAQKVNERMQNIGDVEYYVGTNPTLVGSPRLVTGGVRLKFSGR